MPRGSFDSIVRSFVNDSSQSNYANNITFHMFSFYDERRCLGKIRKQLENVG